MFKIELKDIVDNKVVVEREKVLYNLDGKIKASDWIREGVPKRGAVDDYVKVSSGLVVKQTGRGKMLPGALGYFYSNSNCIEKNPVNVGMFSTTFASANGVSVIATNFDKCVQLFSARKLINSYWYNGKDEYLKPDTSHEIYSEYSYNSLIFSLFHSSSNQSSLREVEYQGQLKAVKNEFFFMSKEKMFQLADKHSNQGCYDDARHDEDRFVAKLITAIEQGNNGARFSDEAQLVLNLARELVEGSFEYRNEFNKAKPEYQINNWDCGWYQIKGLLNWVVDNKKDSEVADKYSEFKDAYKALGDKMRPMVYELGFLKK